MPSIILVDRYFLQDTIWILDPIRGGRHVRPPGYLWAITIAGITAIPAATSLVVRPRSSRPGRRRAALLAAWRGRRAGGWFTASAVIAGHGWYHARLGHGVPWLPVASSASSACCWRCAGSRWWRAWRRRAMVSRLSFHSFRGRGDGLPAHHGPRPSVVLPARGPGDIAAGIAAPLVALRLARALAAAPPCG